MATLLLALACGAQINPEAGAFYFKQYLPEIYNAHPQNWAAVQDARGVMYFGNTDGILEYDGAHWRKIALSNGEAARSLTVDNTGTVYVGGRGEIGYLKADATGVVNYVSLLDRIPAGDRHFYDVWNVYATGSGILFGSRDRIFRWEPDGMKVWRPAPKVKFGRLFVVNGTAYVKADQLCRIDGDLLKPVPGSEAFTTSDPTSSNIRGVFPFAGSMMVATFDGLYRSNGKEFTRWKTDIDDRLRELRIYEAVPLKENELAIATTRGGLLLISPQGRLDRVIDRKSGIGSDAVNDIYADRDGGLWLMLNKGIAHEEVQLPITHFGERQGIEEIVISIQRQDGALYAGTMTGLTRMIVSNASEPHFEPVAGIQGPVFAMLTTPRGLLAGGDRGIFEVARANSRPVLPGDSIYDLSLSLYDPGLLYAVGHKGLYVFRFDGGHWNKVRELPSEGQEFRSVLEDTDGWVWVTTNAAILRIKLTPSLPVIERFTGKDGVLPSLKNGVFRLATRIVFGTPKGLRQFDRARKTFVPCEAFGPMFADGTHAVSMVRQSPTGDVWISGEGYNGVLHNHASGNYTWEENPLARASITEVWALHLDSDDVAWASGSNGGLVRTHVWSSAVPVTSFAAQVQSLQLERGARTLFGGAGDLAAAPRIPHSENALRFEFAAPAFDDESRTLYQVRLYNLDHSWSDWSSETRKEYTNLWEGQYVFHVRARDLYGRTSSEAKFEFTVLPPWFRTWWAYLLYGFGLVAGVWAIVRWRLHALAEANRKLEVIITERTEEIRAQRDTIRQDEEKTRALLLNILPASVAEELSATGAVAPVAYDDITVCFTDFVGFTLSSEGLPPADLVTALHQYFTAFDEIIGRYGLEKLKTIGDSYMFVSGLPKRSASHAVDAVMASLEIAAFVAGLANSRPGWKIRIGIHSGPVVAGVVGVRKFAFDIWGETVNFASRFESSGAPNRVNISAQTHSLVRDLIDCEPRGPISIKEGRKLEMFFVRGIRPDLLAVDPQASRPAFAHLYREKFGRWPRAIPYPKTSPVLVQSVGGD